MIGRSGMRPWLSSCPWDGGWPRFYDAVGYTAKEFWLRVLGVAYAENNGIPLVTLHSLQILDEERLLAVGFGAVIEGPVHVVIVHADPGAVGLDRREGDEIVVVEIFIREGNELFIAAAIMPFQTNLRERGGADVQNGLKVGNVTALLVGILHLHGGVEEVTGRHLTGVTHYDELLAAVDRANGVLGKDLGSFVKNDYVKADIRRTEKRTDTQRETFAGVRL